MTYLTSYCNKAHDCATGMPIEHECIKIPAEALKLEQEGCINAAISVLERMTEKQKRPVRGRAIGGGEVDFLI